jgi:hypothetical protein
VNNQHGLVIGEGGQLLAGVHVRTQQACHLPFNSRQLLLRQLEQLRIEAVQTYLPRKMK